MFSLVNTPMFEQEAPEWYCELCSRGTYVWAVLLQQTRFGPFNFSWELELERDYTFEPEILKPDIESFKALWETAPLKPDFKPGSFFLGQNFSNGLYICTNMAV